LFDPLAKLGQLDANAHQVCEKHFLCALEYEALHKNVVAVSSFIDAR
jgi:hypothetical protein